MLLFSGSGLVVLALFAFTLYALGAVGFVLVRSAQGREPPTPVIVKPTVSGVLATVLAGLALLGEMIVVAARVLPEGKLVTLFLLLLPVIVIGAITGVLLGSLGLRSSLRLWNFLGLVLGTVALTGMSLVFLSPLIFRP